MPLLFVTYSAVFGVGLLLGAIHVMIAWRLRQSREFLFAAVMGVSAGVVGLCEAAFLRIADPGLYTWVFEVQGLAIGSMLIAMTWFVQAKLRSGRSWLAWIITLSWCASMLTSVFGLSVAPLYPIETLQTLTTRWGETYHVPLVMENSTLIVTELTTLAIIFFVLDATIRAARTNARREALWIGGAILFFIVVAGLQTPLVDRGIIQTPYMISPVFLAIALALTAALVDDIAQNANLTQELALERKRWDAVLQGLQLAVLRIGADQKVVYVNPFMETVSGHPASHMIGADPRSLFIREQQAEIGELIRADTDWSVRTNQPRSLRTASGEKRELNWFSVALTDEQGRYDGLIAFGQDRTEQKTAEKERDETRHQLEKLSRALTMGEMASSIAHELSQPVAAVLTNAQSLQMVLNKAGAAASEVDEIVEDIVRDTRRARDLMHQVRDFTFDAEPVREYFELGIAISETVELLKHETARLSATVILAPPPYDVPFFGSKIELQQVVLNTVLNAIQATRDMPDGRATVAWSRIEDGSVQITVDDNGPGIDAALLESIFDPFVTSKETGSGIGLAISRRIIQRHGGKVRAEQSPDGGARIRMTLPLLEGAFGKTDRETETVRESSLMTGTTQAAE